MENVEIKLLTEATPNTTEAINKLLPQLTAHCKGISTEELDAIVHSGHTFLFLPYHNDSIVGMATLVCYSSPTGKKCWIEDVVIDEVARGQKIGKRLIEHLINYAQENGKGCIMLTSRPSREIANRLYQSVGFERRETNVYKME